MWRCVITVQMHQTQSNLSFVALSCRIPISRQSADSLGGGGGGAGEMLGMRRPEYIRYTQPEPLARLTHHFFMGGGPPGFFFICGGPPFFGGPFFAGGPFLGGPCTRTTSQCRVLRY